MFTRRIRPRRRTNLMTIAATVLGLVPAVMIASVPDAGATIPNGVGFTQEGCNNAGSLTLPNGSGQFVCPDADYTTGNLGKNWSELDLVPLRVTVTSSSSTTFSFAVAVDNTNSGQVGFDVLSAPVLNTTLSDPSCGAGTVGSQTTANNQLMRLVTLTMTANSTCVYDYYARLAIGAHLYPGSSLHANLADDLTGSTSGIGTKAVSINPKELAPQSLNKDMTATQNTDHQWSVTKSPSPASLDFINTCDPLAPLSTNVAIQVSWTKLAATPSGVINVITHVYATNPSTRSITVNVSDQIYSGTTAQGSATTSGDVTLAANTANTLVLTDVTTVPSGTTGLNDIATGTYTDPVTGIAIPQTTTATASATVQPGTDLNGTATITDVESITGTGLTFSVDSTSGASGSFGGGYVAGTHTTGSVSWTSAAQSGTNSVTFNKTVYATAATVVSGSLDDTATLTGSDGFTTSDDASVAVSTEAATSLNVSKSTSLQIGSAETFTFHLYDASTNTATGDTATAVIPSDGNGPVISNTITGLSPTGSYYFKEDATAPYAAQTTSSVTFALSAGDMSSCSATIFVTNSAAPATAQVRKNTTPASSGLWTFALTGPNGLSETLTNVQAGAGYFAFASALDVDGGTYTITETPQTGYDLTNVVGDLGSNTGRVTTSQTALTCSLTLNLATDAGKVFECTFTNTARGHIIVRKVTRPAGSTQSFTFTPSYGSPFNLTDGQSSDSGLIVPGGYSVSETAVSGWDLGSATCDNGNSPSNITLAAGATVTCTFTNVQEGTIVVKKVTDPAGSAGSFTFTGTAAGSIGDGGTITVGNLTPGTYTSTESNPTPAYDLSSISCDDAGSATPSSGSVATRTATFKLDPGETVTCTFTNRARGHAQVVKTVNGVAPSGTQSYTFQLRSGASASAAGTILETLVANAADGGVLNFATYLVPGQTYQLCEQMQPGWMTTLGPPFYSVYNPSGDNSVVCTDFTVTSGQTKTFNVNNTPPPGGLALTIGYWKNWSSCSGGRQAPSLDRALLAAANAGHPITEGLLVLNPNTLGAATACRDAVNLLNKTTIDGKKKLASDPLFNMTAQLLAADLNVQAGSGTCASAVSAINQAHALLVKYSFNGMGYSPKLTSADAALANSLATTLDRYNNNKLC